MPTKEEPKTVEELFVKEYNQLKADKAKLEAQVKQDQLVIDELAEELTMIKEFILQHGEKIPDKDIKDREDGCLRLYWSIYGWGEDHIAEHKLYNKVRHFWPKEKPEPKEDKVESAEK